MNDFQNSVYINATKENIWEILIDVENWHQWDKDLKSAHLYGSFSVSTKGILISADNKHSTFFITDIKKHVEYSNYYLYPFFTKLKFTHKIEPQKNNCKVTFFAKFTGLFAWYFAWEQGNAIKNVMENAMKNLIVICQIYTPSRLQSQQAQLTSNNAVLTISSETTCA